MTNSPFKFLCVTAGGLGLLPKAPGTWGSLFPLIVVLACGHFHVNSMMTIGVLLALIGISSVITITLSSWYTDCFGKKDPSQVVSDEVAGQSIALLGMAWLAPLSETPIAWIGLALLSFVLFRIFDIWKPGPIDKSQGYRGGYGVLMDDILAGFVAGILVGLAALLM